MVRLLISLLLLLPTPAFAEEVTPAPVVEAPAYEPPAEAYDGVGGWAVVDPVTNVVHGVVVCTADVCGPNGSWAGVLPGEYQGCTNCNLRFQTRATADGNVAGYSGHSYSSNGQTSNDGSVKWEPSDSTFSITHNTNGGDGTVKTKKKLVPSKTASDGQRLETGLVDIETKYESNQINNEVVKVDMVQPDIDSPSSIIVNYPAWKTLNYDSVESLKTNLDNDVESQLEADGNDLVEPSAFVETIRYLTDKVRQFFGMVPLW